jgi:4-amino-4-deoxy-L-arabinose transferase-like glycosyltransferase
MQVANLSLARAIRRPIALTRLILPAILLTGLLLRLGGISWGLPYLYHPDEPLGAWTALKIFQSGDLNPHFFGYGSLFFYLNTLAYIPYYLVGHLMGVLQSPADIPGLQLFALGVGRSLMPSQIILGRLVSVAIGVLCIAVAYGLGKRLASRRAGWLAAACVALSPSLVAHSQLITPNILAALMVLVALAALMRLTRHSCWPAYVLVGITIGGAVASKYNAGLLVLPWAVTLIAVHGRSVWRVPGVYLSALVALGTFVLVTPYAVLDSTKFIEDTQFHLAYYATANHPGMEGNVVEYYVTYLLTQEGLWAFLGLLATLVYLKRRDRNGLIAASFAVPYVLYVSTLSIRNDRTILIVLPVLLVMAADLLRLALTWVEGEQSSRMTARARIGLIGLIVVSLAYQGGQAIRLDTRLATPDGREYARRWIEANVPANAHVAMESYAPFIDPGLRPVTYFNRLIEHPPDWYAAQGYDWLVLCSVTYERFYHMPDRYAAEVAQYDALRARFAEVAVFDQNGVTVRILRVK